jgi:hypothetical protein
MPRRKKTVPSSETAASLPASETNSEAPSPPDANSPTDSSRIVDETPNPAAATDPATATTGKTAPVPGSSTPVRIKPFRFQSDLEAGVHLEEDRQYKQMRIKFDEKPPVHIRAEVHGEGFRWNSLEQAWSKPIDRDAAWKSRTEAERTFDRACELLREAKGLGQTR